MAETSQTELILSESDLPSSVSSEAPLHKTSLVYSEPAIVKNCESQTNLPQRKRLNSVSIACGSTRHLSVSNNNDTGSRTTICSDAKGEPRSRLQSDIEIRNQHYQKQRQYAQKKAPKKLTDIDFEGILNIIGGCSKWQLTIYIMIAAQQVPHAMFNLSTVYMMYQPDHWCKIDGLNRATISGNPMQYNFTWHDVLNSTVLYPRVPNNQRRQEWHSQCSYFERNLDAVKLLNASELNNLPTIAPVSRCDDWDYDTTVMKHTVVMEYNRVCDNNWSRAHVHLSYSLGYLLGCFVGGFVSDRYGRKTAICGFGVLSLIFGFLLTYAREFEIFLVIRFLLAASNEASDLATYVLCMEITGVKYRSMVGSLLQAPWACGYAFLALVAYLTRTWQAIQMVTVTLHLFAMILMMFLPESPRWLILMDRVEDAEKIIRTACQKNNSRLPSDLGLVSHAEKRKWMKKHERPSYFHLFRSSELRQRNAVLFIIWIVTALVYYGLVIALSDQSSPGRAVFDGNFFLNNAIAGAIELPTLFACVFLLRYGRKRSQMITLIMAGLLILVAMLASSARHTTFALVFMLLGKAFIQGSFNVLYIFTSELNPTIIRNSAVAFCSMMARMGAGASGYIAILSDVTLPIVPMLIFAVCSLFAGVLVILLPETQNLPLPETIWDAAIMQNKQKPCGLSAQDEEEHMVQEESDQAYAPVPQQQNYIDEK